MIKEHHMYFHMYMMKRKFRRITSWTNDSLPRDFLKIVFVCII